MARYAVSGASGFIGSHLRMVLEPKNEFVAIPRKLLYSPKDLEKFFKKENPDYIVNLMAYGNMSNQDDVAQIVLSNYFGAYNMLSASKDIPYKKFIQVGSSSEYGLKDQPMRESDLPNTDTFYGASKLGATYLARAFAVKKPVVIIRPFSVYGEDEADFRFIPTVIRCLLDGSKMELDPSPVHDWIFIDDLISGMLTGAEYAKSGEIVNVGTGRETSNLEIAQILERISNKKLNYEEKAIRGANHWSSDNSKLKSFGWAPKFPLGLGLAKTYEWYKAKYAK